MKFDFVNNGPHLVQLQTVYVGPSCNLVIWQAEDILEGDWMVEVKRVLAKTMDNIADLLHDYQKFAPLVTLIKIRSSAERWNELAGDQDWHRGRFVVQYIDSSTGKSIDEAIHRWLGPIRVGSYHARKITIDDFKKSVAESVNFSRPPKGASKLLFSRYSDNLIKALDADSPGKMSLNWGKEIINDVNNLLEQPLLGGSIEDGN